MTTLMDVVHSFLSVGKEFDEAKIESGVKSALAQQGAAPKGAVMQDKFIDALFKSRYVTGGFQSDICISIVSKLHASVVRYGDSAYPLSEKQIAIVARDVADARMRYALSNCKRVGDEAVKISFID